MAAKKPATSPTWHSWVLTDQAAIDTCADDLFAAGYTSDVHRGKDIAGADVHSLTIHIPGDDLNPQQAAASQAVVLMGDLIIVLTADQYANSPFAAS